MAIKNAAERLARQLVHYFVEPPSVTALADMLSDSPLAMLKPAKGNSVLIMMDTNSYGESDTQPRHRACPIANDWFKKVLRAVRIARTGKDEGPLGPNEIYMCINAGKDRKRLFMKPLLTHDAKGKNPSRTVVGILVSSLSLCSEFSTASFSWVTYPVMHFH